VATEVQIIVIIISIFPPLIWPILCRVGH